MKGSKVSAADRILKALEDRKLLRKTQSPPEMVGVAKANRKSFGVGANESQLLGEQILAQGFSWNKCRDIIDVELPPAPFDLEERMFNAHLEEISGGLIPKGSQVHSVSLAGGHTNTFLRMVKSGVRSVVPSIADGNGKLSLDLLSVGRPEFAEACIQGLKWRRLSWMVVAVWPSLADLLQDSMNADVRGGQSEVEVLLGIHASTKIFLLEDGSIDWKGVERAAAFSNPACSSWIPVLCSYVKANAGGADETLLAELQDFQTAFGSKSGLHRTLGSEFVGKVSTLQFGASAKSPFIQNAMMKTQLASPPNKIVDGQCRLLTTSNIASFCSKDKRELVKTVEALLTEARALIKPMPCAESAKTRLLGQLDCRSILFVCKKTKEVENVEFRSISDIAELFLKECSEACSGTPVHGFTWLVQSD